MDVKALYTNIPNNEGMAVVKRKHVNYTKNSVATKVITTFLALILTLNNFFLMCLKMSLCEYNFIANNINQEPSIIKTKV